MAWKTVSFEDNGGSGGSGVLYINYTTQSPYYFINYWATTQSTSTAYRKVSCNIPTKAGYEFGGYSGYGLSIGKSGYLPTEALLSSLPDTVTAIWRSSWKITFDKGGGTGGTSEVYFKVGGGFYADSACTVPATSITPPTNGAKRFGGYFSNDLLTKYVNPDGSFTAAFTSLVLHNDLTLYGIWDSFGNLTDWFRLDTDDGPLMLVGSTDGATRSVTDTSHSGTLAIQTADSSVGAFERGGILMNPTCTYRIRSKGRVAIHLGKAYGKATISGSGSSEKVTVSGYMLVSAKYVTLADSEPVLVVSGSANEGYQWNSRGTARSSMPTDAINLWTVYLNVNPDHIAQDPMTAVSGGGEMTECTTLIMCDPVVPMENGMPCASDIVHGKVVVTAKTNAYFDEAAPTARSPFIEINGVPPDESDVDFTSYAFQSERSL